MTSYSENSGASQNRAVAPRIKLRNGGEIPALGIGTSPLRGAESTAQIRAAIEAGYRLIDTAENYGNEDAAGQAIRESGIDRSEIFLTTKFNRKWHSVDGVRQTYQASLERLGMDYVDLLLVHWPNPDQDRYVEAVRGLLAVDGALPVNVKVLVEGEEEVGSPHFEQLLHDHAELLRADVVVVSDTGMWAPDVPSTCVGMRGLVGFDVQVRTARGDLHSGMYGGAVPNPAHLLARWAADLHDDEGRVTIPGFYDRVREPIPDERAAFAALPFDEEAYRKRLGVPALVGERGFTTLERVWTRPTLQSCPVDRCRTV